MSTAALRTIQQLAGNRAATTALLALQRERTAGEPPPQPGRIPNAEEQDQWDDPFPKDATFRIVVEPTYGYNCFAWAVGDTSRDITSDTIYFAGGYAPTLDGWTKYLIERQGFSRYRRWSGRERRSDPLRRRRHPGAACRAQGGPAVWVAHVHQQTR